MLNSTTYTDSSNIKYANEKLLDEYLKEIPEEKRVEIRREHYCSMHPYKITFYANMDEWRTYVPAPGKRNNRRVLKRKTEGALLDAIADFYEQKKFDPTVDEVYREWIDKKSKNVIPATIDRHNKCYKRHFLDMKSKRVSLLTVRDWATFIYNEVTMKGLNAKAYVALKSIVKGILVLAAQKECITYTYLDVFELVKLELAPPKEPEYEDEQRVLSTEEFALLKQYLIDHPDQTNQALLLICISGLRAGEAVALDRSDILSHSVKVSKSETSYTDPSSVKKDQKARKIYETKAPKTKAGDRDVWIHKNDLWLLDKIRDLNPSSSKAFLNTSGKPLTTNSLRTRLNVICQNLGIPKRSPHDLRRTYATILIDAKVSEKLLLKQLGQKQLSVAMRRYWYNRHKMEECQNVIDNIDELSL